MRMMCPCKALPKSQFHCSNLPLFETGLLLAVEVNQGQWAFIATPEKALLDLVYLEPGADDPAYLEGLRLQPQALDPMALHTLAARADSPKLQRAADAIADLTACEREGWETL